MSTQLLDAQGQPVATVLAEELDADVILLNGALTSARSNRADPQLSC